MRNSPARLLIAAFALITGETAGAITLGQIDDFEDGGVAGWVKGDSTNLPPTNVADGGPSGAGDNYLEVVSIGGVLADSKPVFQNSDQWTGDYLAAGVERITAQFRNVGETPLLMRLSFSSFAFNSIFVSTVAEEIPPDGQWHSASFSIAEADLTRVKGVQSYETVLSAVIELRILHNDVPDQRGDPAVATLGVDNIEATQESVDSDGDGVPDDEDDFPNDPSETTDTDADGTGDNADADDDNDGVPDESDDFPLGRFDDARPNDFAFTFIEALARSGITAGCGPSVYCPLDSVTRAQMAVFLERGIHGSGFVPPPATGNTFLDVGANDFAAAFIEQFFLDGITGGCGGNNYCPGQQVTRAQMAVFLLRAEHGAGYLPPPAAGVFTDVPLGSFAVEWIEQLAAEGITGGCGGGNYCPNAPVTRAQMAVFLVRTFGL